MDEWKEEYRELFLQCSNYKGHRKLAYTTEQFIKKAIVVHGDKYNYSLVNYITNRTKVDIICPKHGVFSIRPTDHLYGKGCPKCGRENSALKLAKTQEQFIKDAKSKHGDKYDYSKVEYVCCRKKVAIICPKHGVFMQTPQDHLNGNGCPACHESRGERLVKSFLDNNNFKYEC